MPAKYTPYGIGLLVEKLARRLRAAGYNGPVLTARGEGHPDAETFVKSYRAAIRDTRPGRGDVAGVVR